MMIKPFCKVCGKQIPLDYPKKTACSDECFVHYRRQLWLIQYAKRLAGDPELNKKQQKKKMERLKADPVLLAEHKLKEAERKKTSRSKMTEAQKDKERERQRMAAHTRNKDLKRLANIRYKDSEHGQIALTIAYQRRNAKNSERLAYLKENDPQAYAALLAKNRAAHRQRKANAALANLQSDLSKLGVNDE